MIKNRLKTMRKVKRKTQQEIASFIGINQNAYSYWENGKVKIDNESIYRLAEYYGVSVDFLLGRRYRMTCPPELWRASLREDYENEDIYVREYMEYKYGKIIYLDSDDAEQIYDSASYDTFELTNHEYSVVKAYRSHPEMQPAIDRILGIAENGSSSLLAAAHSTDNHGIKVVQKANEKWQAIEDAPDTDSSLM